MEIRKALPADLDHILRIYAAARQFMRETGNPTQWGDHYPPRDMIEQDIAAGRSYVCAEEGVPCAAFAFIPGIDPTYLKIYEGAWLNDAPYAAVHRVASDGTHRGMIARVMDFCLSSGLDIRIDTHRDNKVMQHQLLKNGFTYCGIIYLEDGDERLAYQHAAR